MTLVRRRLVVFAFLFVSLAATASAGTVTLFGPRTFTRATGQPVVERATFDAPVGSFQLHIDSDGVASAVITFNGETIASPSDFRPGVTTLERTVAVRASNEITVELRSKPGTSLRISVTAEDDDPPVIHAAAAPVANGAGWNNSDVTVSFTCVDAIAGVATCPTPIVVSREGAGQVISGEAIDKVGNRSTASVTLNIDKTAPVLVPAVAPAPDADGWNNTDVTVSFTCSDALSGVESCAAPVTVSGSGSGLSATGRATDRAGNAATLSVPVNIDRTAPHITARLSAAANANGWHDAPVTVTFDCTDDTSGIASCPAPVTVDREGAGQIVKGTARDKAGNTAEAAVTVNLDLTAPTLTITPSAPPNASGWYNGDVSIAFACEDALSGVVDCPASRTVTAEGTQTVSATVTDRAGQSITKSIDIKIDRTAPAITAAAVPAPNAGGWRNAPVTVTFTCSDAGSGVASCSAPVTLSTDGAGQTLTGTVTDRAGNTANTQVQINLDRTAPVITASSSANGWTNAAAVTTTFSCSDALSGIDRCADPVTTTDEGARQVQGTAVDKAGNTGTATATARIDRTAPQITAVPSSQPNAAGWYGSDVTVRFDCSDAGSGIASCASPITVSNEGASQLVVGTARDAAGNSASTTATLNVDRTPPVVSIASPAANATVREASTAISGSVSDALSGVVSVLCGGQAATVTASAFSCTATLTQGANAIAIDVTDGAGNVTHAMLPLTFRPNTPPVARAGGPYAGEAGAGIQFDGSQSSDAEGQALSYQWTFGDGGTATGASPTHVFTAAGSFTVDLVVTDSDGASNHATTSVTVTPANRAPVARVGGPYSGDATQRIAFNGSASTDPDGDALTYAWDFGDGSTASGAQVGHAYQAPGSYPARLTVTDGRGGSNTASATVTVRPIDQPPTAQVGGPYSGRAGQAIAFNGSGTDPENDPLTFAWRFSDGGTASGASASHVFASAGTFIATLTVSDGRGGTQAASAQVIVARANTAPVAKIGAPSGGATGELLSFSAAGSSDADNDPLTYAWNFGDGRSATGVAASHAFASAGTFTVTVTVTDAQGDASTASAAVTITAPASNRPPQVSAGGPYTGEVNLSVAFSAAATDADHDSLTYAWDFGDGTTAAGPSPAHVFTDARAFTVSLTVSDGHGGSSTATTTATIAPAADRAPPVITIQGPHEVLPGTQAIVTARVDDNVGVSSVVFTVAGADDAPLTAGPFARTIDVPAVAAPGTTIPVSVTARDAAGNVAHADAALTITAQPDNEKPTITLNAPASATPGSTIRLSATAADNDAIARVTFSTNGAEIGTAQQTPYETPYVVPANAAPGGSIQVTARAEDPTGNSSSASATIAITDVVDSTPPVVHLTAPATAAPGQVVTVSADATDANGIASVTFSVDGAQIAALASPPYQASFTVPASAPAGLVFHVEARATDFAGLDASDAAITQAGAAAPAAGSFVTGEVFDDSTGLPLAGAEVSSGPSGASVLTDARGRFALGSNGDAISIVITHAGYTSVYRRAAAGTGVRDVIDARLTPRGDAAADVTPVLGGTIQTNGARLVVPAGAVASAASVSMTVVSGQGLAGLLPAGWSPIAVVDVAPAGLAFAATAALHVSAPAGVPDGTPVTLAFWNTEAGEWRAAANGIVTSGALDAALATSGQFAWIRADQVPAAPPQPVIGSPVQGVAAVAIPDDATMAITPQPKVIFYQPGVHSAVRGVLTSSAPLPSGTRVWAKVSESYHFYSGAEIYPDATLQDLFFYQATPAGTSLEGSFTASPSQTFEALSLEKGVIGLDLYSPADTAPDAAAIPPSGGSVSIATGERLDFLSGAVSQTIAASLRHLDASDLGVPVPSDLAFIGAVDVTLAGGTVTQPGVLSIAKPADLPADAQVVVARITTVQDRTRFVLTAIAHSDGGRLVGDPVLPINQLEMEGVRVSGRYVFLRAAQPLGFVAGRTLDTANAGVTDAVVSTDTASLVALSRAPDGRYVAATRIGTPRLTAIDLRTSDRGTGTVTLAAARDEVALDLLLVPEPPRVTSATPAAGAINVPLSTPIVALFSEPIDPASISASGTANVVLSGPDGTPVEGTIALSSGNTSLTFRPAAPLSPNTGYTFTIAASAADLSGEPMGTPFVLSFTTLATAPPPPPPAGSLSATIPDNGTTTVRGTQGTAGQHDAVSIENVTTGAFTPVLLDPNGGFETSVAASRSDKLRLHIVDASGNETVLDLPPFRQTNADGSISAFVDASGGRVEGPNGVAVTVPAGAFPDGAVVTLNSLTEAQFGFQLTDDQRQGFSYTGGLLLNIDGPQPQHYLNVSIPAPAGATLDDQWIVTQSIRDANGVLHLSSVDTARVIDGNVATSSPPCPGVLGNGAYGFLRAARPLGVVYGELVTPKTLPPSIFVPFLVPAPGFLALPGAPGNIFSAVNSGFKVGKTLEPYVQNAMNIAAALPRPVCLPLLSGRVSAFSNHYQVVVPQSLKPTDREIIVTHDGTETHAYAPFPATIAIDGDYSTPPRFQIVDADGTSRVAAMSLSVPAYVVATVARDVLQTDDQQITIDNKTRNTRWSSAFNQGRPMFDVRAILEGAPEDQYVATVVGGDGTPRTVPASVVSYHTGTGTMVVRALPGTIDPTRAELDAINAQLPPDQQLTGAPVTAVKLGIYTEQPNGTASSREEVIYDASHPDTLVGGGFVYVTNGDVADGYAVAVYYEDGKTEFISLPTFRIEIHDPGSGNVRTVVGQVPPRDRPLYIDTTDGAANGDLLTPSGDFLNVDPRTPLTLAFSEALDEASVRSHAVVLDGNGAIVPGHWELSADHKSMTFVPDGGIRLASTYTISLAGVTTAFGQALAVRSVPVKTFTPSRLSVLTLEQLGANGGAPQNVTDIGFLRKPGSTTTTITALTEGSGQTTFDQGFNVHEIDVTHPKTPVELGHAAVGLLKRRVAMIPGADFHLRAPAEGGCDAHTSVDGTGMPRFQGDLAVTSSWNIYSSYFTFVDVTDPSHPCAIGDKVVAANPDQLSDYTRPGTEHIVAYSKGVTWLKHDTGYAAFMGASEGGLFAVDIGKNSPSVLPADRKEEGFYAGDFSDVEGVGTRILAYDNSYGGAPTLDVFDASLTPITSVPIDDTSALAGRFQPPGRMVVAGGIKVDRNHDGQIGADETFTLDYVATAGSIVIFNVTDPDHPTAIGRVPMPGPAEELAISNDGRTLYAAAYADATSGNHSLFFIDVSDPFRTDGVDADHDGRDDRIVFEAPFGAVGKRITGLQSDLERGLLYVGSTYESLTNPPAEPFGVEVWTVTRQGASITNSPPVANAGPDQTVPPNTLVKLDGSGSSDADHNQLGYTWRQVSGPTVTLTGATTAQPSFQSPVVTETTKLVFELIVTDGYAASAPDQVVITIRADELHLTPVLVVMPTLPATRQMKVLLTHGDGSPSEDVTTDAPTTQYEWLGHGIAGGTDGVPDLTAILNVLNSKLFEAAGTKTPFTIISAADMSVDANGLLTVRAPGIQIVRARRGDRTSNLSLILAGIKLKDIELQPESALSTAYGLLASAMGTSVNPPMILSGAQDAWFTNHGVVLLHDITLQYLGAGEISLSDLFDAVKPVIQDALEAALVETGPGEVAAPVLAKAFIGLGEIAVSAAGTQFLDPLTSEDTTVATVTDTAPFKGIVSSQAPGVTTITGTLSLGPLGEATDSVLVWVLPRLDSVRVEPHKTVIQLGASCTPGQPAPTVRTYGTVLLAKAASLKVPGKYQSAIDFANKVLPGGVARWASIDGQTTFTTNTPAPNLHFTFRGKAQLVDGPPGALTIEGLAFEFPVPNNLPGISNDFTPTPPEQGKPEIITFGDQLSFDTPVIHHCTEGETTFDDTVDILGLGTQHDTTGPSVLVVRDPFVVKQTHDGRTHVKPGDPISFDITFGNPTSQQLTDVTIVDQPVFNGTPLAPIEIPLGTIGPNGARTITTSLTAPDEPGVLVNSVSCKGATCKADQTTVQVVALKLTPPAIVLPLVKAEAPPQVQLHATLEDGTAPGSDVTASPSTSYVWIGKTTAIPMPDLTPVFNRINDELRKRGEPALPVKIADIDVSPDGLLTVKSPGLQVIAATHQFGDTTVVSNFSYVFAGITLKKIELAPESIPTALMASMVDLKNPPMILAANVTGNTFLSTSGQILLDNATFEILGGPATLDIRDLVTALGAEFNDFTTAIAAEAGPLAPVFGWAAQKVFEKSVGYAGAQLLTGYTSKDTGIATVSATFPKGFVRSAASGLTNVSGTLDLGDFGKASDNVLTWVLPHIDRATVDPNVTVIDPGSNPGQTPVDFSGSVTSAAAPSPYPAVRTSAHVTAGKATFDLDGVFKDTAEAVDEFLPGGLAEWANFSAHISRTAGVPVPGFKFGFDGSANVTCSAQGDGQACSATITSLGFSFHAPNLPPVMTVTYQAGDTAIAHIVPPADASNLFDQYVVPRVAEGVTPLAGTVDATHIALGSAADPSAWIVICPQGGCIYKERVGSLANVPPGSTSTYTIVVDNTTDADWVNVKITDEWFEDRTGPSCSMDVAIRTDAIDAGTIHAHSRFEKVVTYTASQFARSFVNYLHREIDVNGTAVQLTNPISSAGLTCTVIDEPVINEVVTEPQQDWNGDGTVDSADQWVEILTNTGTLAEFEGDPAVPNTGWALEFTDAAGSTIVKRFDELAGRVTFNGRYMVVQNPGGMGANATVRLRDLRRDVPNSNAVDLIDEVQVTGHATGSADEAFARVPDAHDTDQPSDFQRRPATRGQTNPMQ